MKPWSSDQFVMLWKERVLQKCTLHDRSELEVCIGRETYARFAVDLHVLARLGAPRARSITGELLEAGEKEDRLIWDGLPLAFVDAPRALHVRVRLEFARPRKRA